MSVRSGLFENEIGPGVLKPSVQKCAFARTQKAQSRSQWLPFDSVGYVWTYCWRIFIKRYGMFHVTWTTFKFNRNQLGTVSAYVM